NHRDIVRCEPGICGKGPSVSNIVTHPRVRVPCDCCGVSDEQHRGIAMKHFLTITCVMPAIAALVTVQLTAQSHAANARRVPRSVGTPIAEMIRPGEEALIVEATRSRPLEVLPPPNVSAIAWKTRNAAAVLIAQIEGGSADVTEGRDWITSTFQA